MKKVIAYIACIAVLCFSACKEEEDEKFSASVSFSVEGAKALSSPLNFNSSRSVISSSREGTEAEKKDFSVSLLKVGEDGTVKEAVTKDGELYQAKITFIKKSPVTEDVYIAYTGQTYEIHTGEVLLSSIVCLHSDGSYTNIGEQKSTQNSTVAYVIMDSEENISFDKSGNAYFSAREPGGYEVYAYKFDPKTKKRTLLSSDVTSMATPENGGAFLQQFMISEDGSYLYMGITKNQLYTLKVINTVSGNKIEICEETGDLVWTFDEYTDFLYVHIPYSTLSWPLKKYSKEGVFQETLKDVCSYLAFFPTQNGVWGAYIVGSGYSSVPGTTILQNITDSSKADITVQNSIMFQSGNVEICTSSLTTKTYYQTGNTLFILYRQAHTPNDYHAVCRVNLESGESVNIFKNSSAKETTTITSWDTNGSVLYYAGHNQNEVLNGKIDLTTLEHTTIADGQSLSCIAAM
ncbi:MAG: hypothetical protein II821_01965 [Treponema sp.]|nr:hypothetical protein [Treponema sp.]